MLAFFSMVGTAFAELRKLPPVIRWGAAVLVGLLAVELIGREAIELYARMATVQPEVVKKNLEYKAGTVGNLLSDQDVRFGASDQPMSPDDMKKWVCGDAGRRATYDGAKYGCP